MKYSLYKDLLNEDCILSHLFMNCLSKANLEKIANKNNGKTDAEIKASTVEIEVNIDGISVNPKAFFELFIEQHNDMLKKAAKKLIDAQLSEKFRELSGKLSDFAEITENWSKDINWQFDENPLIKKSKKKKC